MEVKKARYSKAGPYIIRRTLGSGGFGVVKKGEHETTKDVVAIKLLESEVSKSEIQNEVLVLKKLNHPYLINLVDFSEKLAYVKKDGRILQKVAIIMEIAEKGTLFEYLKISSTYFGRGFTEDFARTYFIQLIEAIEYCHKQGIAHRDLKPDNLLLDGSYNLKVADFGWATSIKRVLKTNAGTRSYQAPEILTGKEYKGEPADIFSCAIILFIMLSGHPGFKSASMTDPWYGLIFKGNFDKFWDVHEKKKPKAEGSNFYPKEYRDVMNGMLHPDPSKRFTVAQIKEHPWFNAKTVTELERKQEFDRYRKAIDSLLEQDKQSRREEKIQKMQEMENLKQNQNTFSGFKQYRDTELEKDLDKQLSELKLDSTLKAERELAEIDGNTNLASTIYSVASLDLLFKNLIVLANQVFKSGFNLSADRYRVKGRVPHDDKEQEVEMSIEITKNDEESLAVVFTKKSGDQMKFLDIIQDKFREEITKIK